MDWQELPEWLSDAIKVLFSSLMGALIVLFKDALISFLRRLGETLAGLLSQSWADRHFESQ